MENDSSRNLPILSTSTSFCHNAEQILSDMHAWKSSANMLSRFGALLYKLLPTHFWVLQVLQQRPEVCGNCYYLFLPTEAYNWIIQEVLQSISEVIPIKHLLQVPWIATLRFLWVTLYIDPFFSFLIDSTYLAVGLPIRLFFRRNLFVNVLLMHITLETLFFIMINNRLP